MAITALLALLCLTLFTFYCTNYRNTVTELFITTTYRTVISVTLPITLLQRWLLSEFQLTNNELAMLHGQRGPEARPACIARSGEGAGWVREGLWSALPRSEIFIEFPKENMQICSI